MHLNRKSIAAISILIIILFLSACSRSVIFPATKSAMNASEEAVGKDKATWQSQTPEDGGHVEPGSEFDITWNMLNSGDTTWTTDYCLRYFAGTNLTKPGKLRYNLPQSVAPGEVGACSVDAVAPWEPGTYQMFVVLSNGNDENFSKVDITIVVDEMEE